MNISKIAMAIAAPLAVGLMSPANASVLVTDWTIDLAAAGLVGFGTISGVNEVDFTGLFKSDIDLLADTGTTDGLLVATSFKGGGGLIPVTSTGKITNFDFELTFIFSVDNNVSGFGSGIQTISHTGGSLEVYLQDLSGVGAIQANPSSLGNGGAGFDDAGSILIATFSYFGVPTNGGVYDESTFDGSDDATFALVSAMAGVLLSSGGDDLGELIPGGEEILLGIADSNFDADPDANAIADTTVATGFDTDCATSAFTVGLAFCGSEDGSFILATERIPEPGTLALMGLGLAGFAGVSRRRAAKK
ncbi:MAG TPA: PEP-CTERM sorting domain-containing protein [Chromatiales bacterium]|nr:PEP-CTERM sorting domain-containing protein [Chromatiales bacterium]